VHSFQFRCSGESHGAPPAAASAARKASLGRANCHSSIARHPVTVGILSDRSHRYSPQNHPRTASSGPKSLCPRSARLTTPVRSATARGVAARGADETSATCCPAKVFSVLLRHLFIAFAIVAAALPAIRSGRSAGVPGRHRQRHPEIEPASPFSFSGALVLRGLSAGT
jgi:hypothetical protein